MSLALPYDSVSKLCVISHFLLHICDLRMILRFLVYLTLRVEQKLSAQQFCLYQQKCLGK